jgi:nicotinamide mononucleotide transporter
MTLFQWFEVLVVIGFTLYFALTDKDNASWYLIVDSLASICGIFCVVLCATGKKSQYYWGFVNIVAYIVIAMSSKYYGQVMLNALYYLPTQFIGLYVWKRHMNNEKNEVKSKRMSIKQIVIFLLGIIICTVLYNLLLERLGGRETWLDSTTFMISLLANALMVLRYKEQWALWIIVDVITVTMWVIAGDLIMITLWSVYLINAVYGYYMWSKMSSYNLDNE